MKKIILLGLFLSLTTVVYAKDIAKVNKTKTVSVDWDQWAACKKNDDCMVVMGLCSTLEAINKDFLQEHEEYVKLESQSVLCAAPNKDVIKMDIPVQCVLNTCAMISE